MEKLDVVEKQTGPTDWVYSMVTVQKPSKKIRLYIDPQDLNKAPLHSRGGHGSNAKVLSLLDTKHRLWQIQLDDENSKLCTFNTTFGQYRFRHLPFGISSALEMFKKSITQKLEDLRGVKNIMDDILVNQPQTNKKKV